MLGKCDAHIDGTPACDKPAVSVIFNGRTTKAVCQEHLEQIKALHGKVAEIPLRMGGGDGHKEPAV